MGWTRRSGASGLSRMRTSARACGGIGSDVKNDDAMLLELFERVGPSADFEDRVIRGLRGAESTAFKPPREIWLHPMVIRAAGAAAAAVILAGLGYGALSLMQNRRAEIVAMSSANPMMDEAASLPTSQPSFSYAGPFPNKTALGRGYRMVQGLSPAFAVSADVNPNPQHGKEGQNALVAKRC